MIYTDNRIVDESGEVLEQIDGGWFPETQDDIDKVLSNLAVKDAFILSLKARREALIANMDDLVRKAENDRERYANWHRPAIERVARGILDATGNKSKTVSLPHGKVYFRKTRESVELLDQEAALKWAKENKPELVHIEESVLKSELEPHVPADCPFLKRNPSVEELRIETGVKQ